MGDFYPSYISYKVYKSWLNNIQQFIMNHVSSWRHLINCFTAIYFCLPFFGKKNVFGLHVIFLQYHVWPLEKSTCRLLCINWSQSHSLSTQRIWKRCHVFPPALILESLAFAANMYCRSPCSIVCRCLCPLFWIGPTLVSSRRADSSWNSPTMSATTNEGISHVRCA